LCGKASVAFLFLFLFLFFPLPESLLRISSLLTEEAAAALAAA